MLPLIRRTAPVGFRGYALRGQGGNEIDVVFQRNAKRDRMRRLQVAAKNVVVVHRSLHRDLTKRTVVPGAIGAIVAGRQRLLSAPMTGWIPRFFSVSLV